MVTQITKKEWVTQQTVEASATNKVTVRSGIVVSVWMAFRCLYCGEYFAQKQAEEHFGHKRIHHIHSVKPDDLIEIEVVK